MAELKVQERDKKRHRRKLLAEWLKDWTKPREDLLCEDHRVSGGHGSTVMLTLGRSANFISQSCRCREYAGFMWILCYKLLGTGQCHSSVFTFIVDLCVIIV